MTDILKIENISLTYYTKTNETLAIKDLSFTVEKGEFIAVIGPSGCGKTTLLSLICGTLMPTSGKIFLNGNQIKGTSRSVGYMLQHDQLFDWRNIYKNLTLGLEIQKKNPDEGVKHVEELMHKYGLSEFRKHYPNQLSGGMRQRAALIRTLALNPEILLLDEAFSALDFQTRLHVCDDVHSIIKNEGITALLVTHDISEAISMADKIVILTGRPATVKRIHETKLSDVPSPLLRREDPSFAKQFEQIWKEVTNEE